VGKLQSAIKTALQRPDKITMAAVIDAADKTLSSSNFSRLKPELISLCDKATLLGLLEQCLALLATMDDAAPDNPDILRRVGECLSKLGDRAGCIAIADRLYELAETIPDRAQAVHLRLKMTAQSGSTWENAEADLVQLRGLLLSIVGEAVPLTLDQSAWAMGALFWFAGYFADDWADRDLINQVAAYCQGRITQCI
jgi:hypothetical protein